MVAKIKPEEREQMTDENIGTYAVGHTYIYFSMTVYQIAFLFHTFHIPAVKIKWELEILMPIVSGNQHVGLYSL